MTTVVSLSLRNSGVQDNILLMEETMLMIRKLRLRRGWSQAELAQFSGLSVRTVQRIERGEKPGLETLKSLAAVFDMEVSEFMPEEQNMNRKEHESGVTTEEQQAME